MEPCRCAFGRDWASTRDSRRPSVHLGLDGLNLDGAWTGMTRSGCDKPNSTKKQRLWTIETGHRTSSL
jgi:hypothetical protein